MSSQAITLEEVLVHNRSLKKGPQGLVGVFVGGTSGIGEWTLRAFIKHTNSPRAYVIGRNQAVASKIVSEAQSTNPEAKISFISADCTLLKEVSRVCQEIKNKEDEISGPGKGSINLLVLSQSSSGLGGRSETPEGLDGKLTLVYYSRLLFAQLLAPLLTNAHTQQRPSRIISVLLTGRETRLDLSNLALKNKYSQSTCLAYATTMTTLAFHHLAKINPGLSYLHTNPGIVKTGVMRYLPWYLRAASHAGYAVLSPWRMEVEESGERHLEMGMARRYVSADGGEDEEGLTVEGIAGRRGAYTLWKDGSATETKEVVGKMVEEGAGEKVWEHTLGVFEAVEKRGKV